jgi:uncharacterized protein YgfB (UPF0149 family)
MLQVTFPEIVRVLEVAGSSVAAAESHGCLCGALCTSAGYTFARWVEEIVPEDAPAQDEQSMQALQLLFTDTVDALRGDAMEFHPLLPDDDVTLDARATALSQWCQGFLYGFGTGGPVKVDELPANVNEVLRDVTDIGRSRVDVGDAGEAEEQAYSEVVEYLRVGVQLIHDELAAVRGEPVPEDEAFDDDERPADDDDPPIH